MVTNKQRKITQQTTEQENKNEVLAESLAVKLKVIAQKTCNNPSLCTKTNKEVSWKSLS